MKVYAVELDSIDSVVDAVFATRELAEAHAAQLTKGPCRCVTEYEVLDAPAERVTVYSATQRIGPDGSRSGLEVSAYQAWSYEEDARPEIFHRVNASDARYSPGFHYFGARLPDREAAIASVAERVAAHLAGVPVPLA